MSKIDEQIHELKKRKKKIELLEDVRQYANSLENPKEFSGDDLAGEVSQGINKIIDKLVNQIENGKNIKDQVTNNSAVENPKKENTLQSNNSSSPGGKNLVEFAQKHSHLYKKSVKGITLNGDQVEGVVRHIDYPYIGVVNEKDGDLYSLDPQTIQVKE